MDIQFQPSSPNRNNPNEAPPCLDIEEIEHLAALLERAVTEGHVSIGSVGEDTRAEIASSHQIKIETDNEGMTLRLSKLELRRLGEAIE